MLDRLTCEIFRPPFTFFFSDGLIFILADFLEAKMAGFLLNSGDILLDLWFCLFTLMYTDTLADQKICLISLAAGLTVTPGMQKLRNARVWNSRLQHSGVSASLSYTGIIWQLMTGADPNPSRQIYTWIWKDWGWLKVEAGSVLRLLLDLGLLDVLSLQAGPPVPLGPAHEVRHQRGRGMVAHSLLGHLEINESITA